MVAAPVGEGETLRGRSGILHVFSKVEWGRGPEKVLEEFNREVEEADIVGLYAKLIDVGVRRAEVAAPSWTRRAAELAEGYGIGLKKVA